MGEKDVMIDGVKGGREIKKTETSRSGLIL